MKEAFIPQASPETARFWEGTKNSELWIQRCNACGRPYFYPRPFCPHCNSDDVEWFQASGRARLISYVISHRAVPGLTPQAPYVVALVELAEGPRMATNLVGVAPDPDHITLDMPLRVTFQHRGEMSLSLFQPDSRGGAGPRPEGEGSGPGPEGEKA